MGMLERRGPTRHLCQRIVLPAKRQRTTREQTFDDVQRLCHTLDAHTRLIKSNTALLVFGSHPTSPKAELESSVTEHIESGSFLSKHYRMAKVIIIDEGTQANSAGGGSCHGQTEGGRKLI